MAGPRTTQVLAPTTYAAFYQLAHAFSEVVIASIVSIANYAAVVIIWSQRFPPSGGPAPVEAPATALRTAAQQCVADTRRCFWPDGSGHALNESRWVPYDRRAWDRFYGQVVQVLRHHLPQLAEGIQQVQAAGAADVRNADAGAPWRVVAPIAVTAYQHLQTLVTEAGFEARLFGARPAAREPSER